MLKKNTKNKTSGITRSYTIQSNKSTSYKSNITNNMINSVINLFQTNKEKEKEKEKNSTIYNNFRSRSEITTDRGKHICLMYWCEEHLGVNLNEPIVKKSNNLGDLVERDSSTNINRYRRMNNQTETKCSSCNII